MINSKRIEGILMKKINQFKKAFLCILSFLLAFQTLAFNTGIVQAEETQSPQVIRVLDGNITKKDLYSVFSSFGGGASENYRYSLTEQTAWKKIEYDEKSSSDLAENMIDGKCYTLQSENASNSFDDWETIGTFIIQFYHNIAIQQADDLPVGGEYTISGGTQNGNLYEINDNSEFILSFTAVDGYDFQIKVDNGIWTTCTGDYTFKADRSVTLSVRYIEQDDSYYNVNLSVKNANLGEYSGLNESRFKENDTFSLTVIPYNEKTNSAKDYDAYVRSVKINGIEMLNTGSFNDTVFTLENYQVTQNTSIEIEFSKRLVFKDPTESHIKHEGDSEILMYLVKYNKDQLVSEQVDEIEQFIINSIIDTENTAGFNRAETIIELKAYISFSSLFSKNYYGQLDETLGDIVDASILNYLNKYSIWGNVSFGNDEEWEEIRITLPATERYPEVVTEDLTIYLEEIRPTLKIDGTADAITADSDANIKGVIEQAVLNKLLADNQDIEATLDKIGSKNISYSYTAPSYSSLKTDENTNVTVNVSTKKNNHFLASSGSIVIPVKKASTLPSVNVSTNGKGKATYTANDSKTEYQFTFTPNEGYVFTSLSLKITKESSPIEEKVLLSKDCTFTNDVNYSYSYLLSTEINHEYTLYAIFDQYSMNLETASSTLPFYNGLYQDTASLIQTIENQTTLTQYKNNTKLNDEESFPNGVLTLEYLARSQSENLDERWVTIGAILSNTEDSNSKDYKCTVFGSNAIEKIRYHYQINENGYEITSNPISLTLQDNRLATLVKLNADVTIPYSDYSNQTNKTDYIKQLLLDGVYTNDTNNPIKLENAEVTLSIDCENLNAEENIEIKVSYDGDATYQYSWAIGKLTITPLSAAIEVNVSDNVLQYGNDYQITVTTQPSNLNTIQLVAGVDLSNLSRTEESSLYGAITNLSLIAPQEIANTLNDYLESLELEELTLSDLIMILSEISEDQTILSSLGISKENVELLLSVLEMFFSSLDTTPVTITNQLPQDVGFYLAFGIVSQANYENSIAMNYLTITPVHYRVDLGWKNELENNYLTGTNLLTEGYLDAQITKVPNGIDINIAQESLSWIFIGVDENNSIVFKTRQNELTSGVYTQIAFTANWGNTRYSCLPLVREFIIDGEHVDVQFIDDNGQAITSKIMYLDDETAMKVKVTDKNNNTLSDEQIKNNLQIYYLPLITSKGIDKNSEFTAEIPTQFGIYLANAIYQGTDSNNTLLLGKASALLILTNKDEDFSVADKTVTYDGKEHFIDIKDNHEPSLSYIALIINKAEKKINILFPETFNGYESLKEVNTIAELLYYFEYFSTGEPEADVLKALLKQMKQDIQLTTDYLIEINGKKPIETGTYDILILSSSSTKIDGEDKAKTNYLMEKGVLNITKTDAVIQKNKDADEEINYPQSALLAVDVKGKEIDHIPSGKVTFSIALNGKEVQAKTVDLYNGTAIWNVENLVPGTYTWKITNYSGDNSFEAINTESDAFSLVVQPGVIKNIDELLNQVKNPTANEDASSKQLTGTNCTAQLSWDSDTKLFEYDTVYTATLQVSANLYYIFEDVQAEDWTIVEKDGMLIVTKTFEATEKKKEPALNGNNNSTIITGDTSQAQILLYSLLLIASFFAIIYFRLRRNKKD